MKFFGKFKGCVRETIVNSKGVSECEYKAELRVQSVNCSQKTAFLIDVKDEMGEYQDLAYLEDFGTPVLRSASSSFGTNGSNGITSTYFEGKYLIHQVSYSKTDCKGHKEWVVKYFKLKQC
jgi:hypothetical protein